MTWPSVDAPASAPSDHGEVRTQAYYAGGGDYFRSGYYSHGLFTSAAFDVQTLSLGWLNLRPFFVPVRRGFDRIGINVTTAAGAGGVVRLGIYTDAGGKAGSLVVDAGTVDSTTTGVKTATISVTLNPGVYWIANAGQVAAAAMTIYHFTTITPIPPPDATTVLTTAVNRLGQVQTGVTGALPSTAAPIAFATQAYMSMLRAT